MTQRVQVRCILPEYTQTQFSSEFPQDLVSGPNLIIIYTNSVTNVLILANML